MFSLLDEVTFADNYTMLCTIETDFSRAPILTRPKNSNYGIYYYVEYEAILLFGMTELQAQIAWKENVSRSSYVVQSNRYRINFMRGF